jgi:tetratricopeptide (TPR) repeat protein
VLAFRNITGSGEDDWLGTGIAETLTADLRRVAGLSVVAHDRVHEVMGRLEQDGDVPEDALAVEAGREFGARWVVSGGFQRAGEAIRVTGLLTEVQTGRVAHTVKVDGRLGEIFDVQDRIARELSTGLSERAAPGERKPEETQLIEAYEAFSRGVINLRVETYESLDRAVLLFERATSLDPRYARAHLELGSSYATKADYLTMPELFQRALDAYRRALELGPRMPRAWREMGTVLVSLGREEEGLQAIRHALELDAEDPGALAAMGRALFIGRADFAEAARYFDLALERNRQGGWYALQLSHCAALMRQYERGEAAARRAIALQEAFLSGQEGVRIVGAYVRLGHLRSLQGDYESALEQFTRERDFLGRADHALRSRISIELHMRTGAAQLALGQAAPGRRSLDAAAAAFEERARLGADEPFTRYYAACAYALRGDNEPALACLERALRQRRPFTLARARIEPELEGLRRDPRLVRLLAS